MRIRTIRSFLLLSLAIAGAAPPAAAQPSPAAIDAAPAATIEELVRLALRDNPELVAMRAGAKAAASRPAQARALPEPRFTFGWMGEHIETARGPQTLSYGLSQEIPFFGKRGLMGEMAKRDAGAAHERVQAMELAVAAEVRRLAVEISYLDEALTVQGEDRQLLDEIGEIAGTRYVTGTSSLENLARIEVELAESEHALLEFHRERDVATAEINRILGRDAETPLPAFPRMLSPDSALAATADSLAALTDLRPEIRAAEEAIARSDAAARLARRSYLPDFMLGAQYLVVDEGMSTSPDAGMDAWMVEVGVNVPIWFGKLRAGVREAKSMQAESRAVLAAERNRIHSEIAVAAAQVRRASEIARLYREKLLPQAELALNAARSSYRSGGIGFLDLLDSERGLIRARLAAARARADWERSMADLERATAHPLPAPLEGMP